MQDRRTDDLLEKLDGLLGAIEEELGAIAVEEALLLRRKGQLAEVARRTRPIVRRVSRRHIRRDGEALERLTA